MYNDQGDGRQINIKTIIKQTRVQFPLCFSINSSKQRQTVNLVDMPKIHQNMETQMK